MGFNTDDYTKQIDGLLKFSFDEYKKFSTDIPKLQMGLVKTYLWIASALIAIQGSMIHELIGINNIRVQFFLGHIQWTTLFSFLSIIVSFSVFCIGIDTMRGKKWGIGALGDLIKTSDYIYNSCNSEKSHDYPDGRIYILRGFNDAINHYNIQNSQRVKKLRAMSYGLLISAFLFAIFVILSFINPLTRG